MPVGTSTQQEYIVAAILSRTSNSSVEHRTSPGMLSLHLLTAAVLIRPLISSEISVDVSKPSLTLCCDVDEVLITGRCKKSFETSGNYPGIRRSNETDKEDEIVPGENVRLYTDDPCNYEWMTSWVPKKYVVLENGSIYAEESGGKALSDYCLFRNPKSLNYSAKVCRPWLGNVYWSSFCLIVAILVSVAIFIGYSIVPELRNLHGLMLRSYLASYMLAYGWALVVTLTAEIKSQVDLFPFYVFTMEYWGVACVFWLNVMSFDIWRTVRCFRSFESNCRARKRKKYIWFAIFAWLMPAILITGYASVMLYTPIFQDVIFRQVIRCYSRVGVKTVIFSCNTYFYASTALTIRRHKKDTANLANSINRHHEEDKQWINLHVKLYLIMGGHMIPWIIWNLWLTPVTTSIVVTMEMLQSVLIFYVFLWKDNVRKALRKKFIEERYSPQYAVSTITLDTGLKSNSSITI